jgi:hypothetical protein
MAPVTGCGQVGCRGEAGGSGGAAGGSVGRVRVGHGGCVVRRSQAMGESSGWVVGSCRVKRGRGVVVVVGAMAASCRVQGQAGVGCGWRG